MSPRVGTSLLFCLASACVQSPESFERWVGRDATVLREVLGQPTEETVGLGGTAMIYLSYWRNGVANDTHRCERTFAVNPKGVITGHASSDC
jgi:hypothetical protein